MFALSILLSGCGRPEPSSALAEGDTAAPESTALDTGESGGGDSGSDSAVSDTADPADTGETGALVEDCLPGDVCVLDEEAGWFIYEPRYSKALGVSAVLGGDLDGDGLADPLVGGSNTSNLGYGNNDDGAVFVFLAAELAQGTSVSSQSDWTLYGADGDYVASGGELAYLPDLDGDGGSEVLVGGLSAWDGAGTAYLVTSSTLLTSPRGSLMLDESADHTLINSSGASGDGLGHCVRSAGDFDGDGAADLLVAGHGLSLVPASALVPGETDVSALTRIHVGAEGRDNQAAGAGVGDIDGDGLADVLLASADYGAEDDYAGRVYVFHGASLPPPGAEIDGPSADFTLEGASASALGHASAGLGDVNGDGLDDLAVSAPWDSARYDRSGAVYLVIGANLLAGTFAASDVATLQIQGQSVTDLFGYEVGGGDFDGDGAPDLAEASLVADSASLFLNSTLRRTGTIGAEDAEYRFVDDDITGPVPMGDVNGDGRDELLIGAWMSGWDFYGAVFVVEGR